MSGEEQHVDTMKRVSARWFRLWCVLAIGSLGFDPARPLPWWWAIPLAAATAATVTTGVVGLWLRGVHQRQDREVRVLRLTAPKPAAGLAREEMQWLQRQLAESKYQLQQELHRSADARQALAFWVDEAPALLPAGPRIAAQVEAIVRLFGVPAAALADQPGGDPGVIVARPDGPSRVYATHAAGTLHEPTGRLLAHCDGTACDPTCRYRIGAQL